MLEDLYLCASTLDKLDLDTRIAVAVAGGYTGIGLRPSHLEKELASGTPIDAIRGKLAEANLQVVEIGFLANWWEEDTERTRAHEEGLYRLHDAVGGRHVMAISGPLDGGVEHVAERFAGLCERAARHELVVALEFLPWTDVDSAKKAWEIIEASGQHNAGVVLDTWHHSRGTGENADLLAIPADRFVAIQISDGSYTRVGTELEDTFHNRRLPGDGDFELAELLALVAGHGVSAPVGVEVLSDELRKLDSATVAVRGAEATRAVLSQALAR